MGTCVNALLPTGGDLGIPFRPELELYWGCDLRRVRETAEEQRKRSTVLRDLRASA